jgi:Predicted NADH:ubiquinone oxidoreductase, subunit RnfC
MHLMPMKIEAAVLLRDVAAAKDAGIMNCMECGSCAYNCPAKRPLTQAIRLGKKLVKEQGV